MLPYYDIQIAKQSYNERLQSAELERQWLALRRQQPSALQYLVAAVPRLVGAVRSASSRAHSAVVRHA